MIDGIQVPRFRRHLFITVSITMLLLILGGLATRTADQVGRAHFEGDLPNMVARLVDATLQTKSPNVNNALRSAFASSDLKQNSFLFWLTSWHGNILLSSSKPDLIGRVAGQLGVSPKPDHPFEPAFVPKRRPPVAVIRMESDPQKLLVLQLAWHPHPRIRSRLPFALYLRPSRLRIVFRDHLQLHAFESQGGGSSSTSYNEVISRQEFPSGNSTKRGKRCFASIAWPMKSRCSSSD